MSHKVNREDFLRRLEEVRPGLSPREILEQSSSFAFQGGMVRAFNEEVACRAPSGLPKEFTAAVVANKLTEVVRRLPDAEIEVEAGKEYVAVCGKRRRAEIRMQAEVLLPDIPKDEKPEKWTRLHEDFTEAVQIVEGVAGQDESDYVNTCVHFAPDWVESTDRYQIARYKFPTGVKESFLVKRDGLKHVLDLDVSHFAQTATWVHFKGPTGVILSCRRVAEQYHDLTKFLDSKNTKPVVLPKALAEAVERAEIFSNDDDDQKSVTVELRSGKLRMEGASAAGRYEEFKNVKYDGPRMRFRIKSQTLREVVRRHADCKVSDDFRLLVDGGKWRYVAYLTKFEEKEGEK